MIPFIFFGSSRLSVIVLDELDKLGLKPVAIVTTPGRPQGRSMKVMPNVVRVWADEHNIKVFEPETFDTALLETLRELAADVFIVASYGKILPASVISIPPKKTLNIHPSLLPKYRGPSPLPSAILDDAKDTGVTIMRLDEKMDHGPIVGVREVHIDEWPTYEDFEEYMARTGARLIADILPPWVKGEITEVEQDHDQASYTKKIVKEDALIYLGGEPYQTFRAIQAYHAWPQAYFLMEHRGRTIRVKVTSASYKDKHLIIEKVIPEGGREMSYEDFFRGYIKK